MLVDCRISCITSVTYQCRKETDMTSVGRPAVDYIRVCKGVNLEGVQGWQVPLPEYFFLPNNRFFGYRVEEGQKMGGVIGGKECM